MGISGHAGDVMAEDHQPQESGKPEGEPRCDPEQYAILKRCSDRGGDISEWQQYRENHPDEEIWLCGADLSGVVLKSPAYEAWRKGHEPREMTHDERWRLRRSHEVLGLRDAHLDGANLTEAHLDGANLFEAHLDGAGLWKAHLDGADLLGAHLEGARLWETHLDGADLQQAHLEGAGLFGARLDGANLLLAHLDGANLHECKMRGTGLRMGSVNGQTVLTGCRIDRRTDATGTPLDAARVEPGLKQLLEYNVRRLGWERWYWRGRWWLRLLKHIGVWPFWLISDYGARTVRIIGVFMVLAAIFALVYWQWPQLLTLSGTGEELRGYWHALYFSVVTQTTLGFGDIHANPDSWVGQALLMLQVILGYVLLGALVTRFAVLFTAGGPAGRFSPRPREKQA